MPQALSEQEASRERAMREVEATMLVIESAMKRADQALQVIDAEPGSEAQHRAALVHARRDLAALRRRLHQEAFLYSDLLPLE